VSASISDHWADHQPKLQRVCEELTSRLRTLCRALEDQNYHFHHRFIESRIKDVIGVKRSLKVDACEPEEMLRLDDLVGARIVVPTASDVELIVSRILETKELAWAWKRADIDDTDTGYRGVHLKGLYPGPDFQVGCEIQVRTILTDAWS